MNTAKLFNNGRSQAVRLPKDCRFTGDEVCIARVGPIVVLYPRERGWELMARGIAGFTDDFMAERRQPRAAERRRRL